MFAKLSEIFKKSASQKYNDIAFYYDRLSAVCNLNNYQITRLGEIENYPIVFLCPKKTNPKLQNILIMTGAHGDEKSGPWGILYFLENIKLEKNILEKVNVSFLPLMNPTGFGKNERYNNKNENVDKGYCHNNLFLTTTPTECSFVLKDYDIFKLAAQNGFLSIHEDNNTDKFFIRAFVKNENKLPKIVKHIKTIGNGLFKIMPKGHTIYKGYDIENDIIKNECDGSLEDKLFHDGIENSMCIEIPAENTTINYRIKSVAEIIKHYIYFFSENLNSNQIGQEKIVIDMQF